MPSTKSEDKTGTPTTERSSGAKSQAATSLGDAGDEVLTLAEAADFLRVSLEDVVRSVGPFGLPGRQIGDEWRFLKSALQAWLATGPRPSGKEALLSLAGVEGRSFSGRIASAHQHPSRPDRHAGILQNRQHTRNHEDSTDH